MSQLLIIVMLIVALPILARDASPMMSEAQPARVRVGGSSTEELPNLGMKIQVISDGSGGTLVWYRPLIPSDGQARNVVLDCNANGIADSLKLTTIDVERAETVWVGSPDPSSPHILSAGSYWSLQRPITFFISKNDGGRYIYADAAVRDPSGALISDWNLVPCISK